MNTTTADSVGLSSAADEGEGYEHYRAMSGSAVVSVILAVISLVALLPDFWLVKAIPVFGILAGLSALRRISLQPDELSGRKVALVGVVMSAAILVTGSAWSAYDYATEIPDPKYQRIDYSMLKDPDPARKNAIPPAAIALEGKQVFIKGYMFPTQHKDGITKFILCRDNGDCCFGKEPPKSDMVLVDLKEPLTTYYSTGVRRVAGTFRITGSHLGEANLDVFYRLEADYIK